MSLKLFLLSGVAKTYIRERISLIFTRNISLYRHLNHESKTEPSQEETRLTEKLKRAFPEAACIQVVDVSGGCGSMYEIHVASKKFEGIKTVNQHKMINEVLKDDIKKMHGVRINTSADHNHNH